MRAVAAGEVRVPAGDGAELAATVLPGRTGGERPAPTVVLVHGWGAARRVWRPVADRLVDAGHTVVVYDQRGHGSSTLGAEPIGLSRLARDLAAVLDHLDIGDAVLVGHSGGGYAAMACAAGPAAIGRLRGLVVVSSAAHDQDTSRAEAGLLGSRALSWAMSRRRLGSRLIGHTLGDDPDPSALHATREMFAATPARVRGACFRSTRGMDLRDDLPAVAVPAVVLVGERDTAVGPDLARDTAGRMRDARCELLPSVGHMVPLEAPDAVCRAVAGVAGR